MPDTDAAHWDNYWRGRASHQTGNALVEVGIENNHALKEFWLDTFQQKSKSAYIIDFACGAGSVLEHAHTLGFSNLTGVDVSQKALDVMMQKIPAASGICSHVDKTPLEDESADFIVSQFGVEYAGSRKQLLNAFREMHRLLKPGGEITIIAHAKDGIIYEGCEASLKNAKIIEDSQFLEIAKKTIIAIHKNRILAENPGYQKLIGQLNESAEPIMAWLRGANREKDDFAKFSYHALESSHKLITHHNSYSKIDTLNWFKGIQSEIDAYKGRMSSMIKAALSKDEIESLIGALALARTTLKFSPLEPLFFPPNKKQAAWIIRAQKQA